MQRWGGAAKITMFMVAIVVGVAGWCWAGVQRAAAPADAHLTPVTLTQAGGRDRMTPVRVDRRGYYLFYLGSAEMTGPAGDDMSATPGGRYDLVGIRRALEQRGFIITRERWRDPAQRAAAIEQTAQRIRRLQAAGVQSSHMVVVGYAEGGSAALQLAATLADPRLSLVLIGGCEPGLALREGKTLAGVRGRVLSVVAMQDEQAHTCRQAIGPARHAADGNGLAFEELVLQSGGEQGGLRAEIVWTEAIVGWARTEIPAEALADDGLVGEPLP